MNRKDLSGGVCVCACVYTLVGLKYNILATWNEMSTLLQVNVVLIIDRSNTQTVAGNRR